MERSSSVIAAFGLADQVAAVYGEGNLHRSDLAHDVGPHQKTSPSASCKVPAEPSEPSELSVELISL